MEAVRVLIQKLMEQEARREDAPALLQTARRLAAELEALMPRPAIPESGRVAVLMPAYTVATLPEMPSITNAKNAEAVPEVEDVIPESAQEAVPESVPEADDIPINVLPTREEEPVQPEAHTLSPAAESEAYSIKPPRQQEITFNMFDDIPTLAQHAPPQKELFELASGESLNDKLKSSETELAHKLTGGPIKDLRKGIGVNDRYLFINELFRGDEAMYERSIKTINAFHILPEAEYWITRELSVKQGWDESNETVVYFYQLVKRRFS